MLRRVLLAIDNDSPSWAAARLTSHLVDALKARVTVLHVHFLRAGEALENDPHYRAARALVDDVGLDLSRHGARSNSEVRVAQQPLVAVEILAAAREAKADLIVLGSRGRLGATGFLTGSVSRDVLEGADVPVLVVRESAELPQGPPRRLLLAVDGAEDARRLTDLAIGLARAFAAEVLVAHVGYGRTADLERVTGLPDADLSGGELATEEAVRRLSEAGVKVTTIEAENLSGIAVELARAADQSSADLIIVGARRAAGMADRALGQVYAGVVANSRVPVVVDTDLPDDSA